MSDTNLRSLRIILMPVSIVRFSGLITGKWLSTFFRGKSGQWDEQVEGPGLAPAVVEEVAVQGEYVAGVQFVRHVE